MPNTPIADEGCIDTNVLVDDNKFVDCAIAAQADYIITTDHHLAALNGSGYKPRPISPQEFIQAHLIL